MGAGAIFSDLDDNGRPELYIANDGQPNRLYTAVPDDSSAGFHFADLSLSADDGDLDIAINTIGGVPALLQNNHAPGNWLQIQLNGFYPGAVVEVELPDGRILRREWHVGSSYLASEDTRLHVGLGQFDVAALVRVRWQDGVWEQTAVATNQLLKLP